MKSVFLFASVAIAAPTPFNGASIVNFLHNFFDDDSAATTTSAVAATATTAATSAATNTQSKINLDSLLSNGHISEWLSYFGLGSDDDDTTTSATSSDAFPTFTHAGTSAATSTIATSEVATSEAATYVPTTFSTRTSSTLAAASSSGSSDITGDKEFAQEMLDAHNKYRAQHLAPDLTWDDDAYQYAANNAANYDCSGVLTHTHGQFGENLAAGFSSGAAAVKAWYDEGETYDYSAANTYNHFTQVVWKSTTKVGCAYKDCRAENWGLYVVCEYDPAGNIIGRESANVLSS